MITLRPTLEDEVPLLTAVEADKDTSRWLADTSAAWHQAALQDSDQEHLILLDDGQFVGFVVLAGLSNPHRSIELRRLVVASGHRRRGVGRRALRTVVRRAFGCGAHRVWLDVKEANRRAQSLYLGEGFVREGLLRDVLREGDGTWSSLVVMSQLESEGRPG